MKNRQSSDSGKKKFEDTKGVIRSHKSKKDRHHNGQAKKGGQRDKQQSTKHYTEKYCLNNTNITVI